MRSTSIIQVDANGQDLYYLPQEAAVFEDQTLVLADATLGAIGWGKFRLQSPLSIYVNGTTGDDTTLTGSQTAPFKTINAALNWILYNVDQCGNSVVVNVAPGTYTEALSVNQSIGSVTIQGVTGNPSAVKLTSPVANKPIISAYQANLNVYNVEFTSGANIVLDARRSDVYLESVVFNAANVYQIYAYNTSRVDLGSVILKGSSPCFVFCQRSAVGINGLTFQNNPVITAFLKSNINSYVEIVAQTSGNATGSKGLVAYNSTIKGVGFLPNTMTAATQTPGTGGFIIN